MIIAVDVGREIGSLVCRAGWLCIFYDGMKTCVVDRWAGILYILIPNSVPRASISLLPYLEPLDLRLLHSWCHDLLLSS